MGNATSSTVKLIFDGTAAGGIAAAKAMQGAMRGLVNDQDKLEKSTKKVTSEVTNLAKSFGQLGAIGLGAAGVGAVGAAAAAAIPALVGFGAAGLTVKLGMDGIKKSAESMQKPIDDLKTSVSATFEKGLTPSFQRLAAVVPQLTGQFQGIAKAISGVLAPMLDFVSSARGVALLKDALQGAQNLISGLGDGLTTFLDGFLSAVASGTTQMKGLGEAIGSVFGKLGNTLQTLANDEASTFANAIDGISATVRGLGDVAAPVVDLLIRMGATLGNSLGNALTQLGAGITNAAPGLIELASAGAALLDALSPLLPTIGSVAGALASAFAGSIRTLIPTIQALVGFINEHKDQLVALAPIISTVATAYAEFKVLTAIQGWVATAVAGLRAFTVEATAAGTAAEAAGAKTAAMGTKLGLIKGAAAAAALAGVAIAMDQVNTSAAGGADNLGLFEGELHNIVGAGQQLASGDIVGIFNDINDELEQLKQKAQTGESAFGQFLGSIKRAMAEPLPPLTFDVDTGPGERQISTFIRAVNGQTALVNINGNSTGAAFALREILAEIAAGKESVIIDGQPMPAQDALKYVEGLINNSNPEIMINGNPQQAGDALAGFLSKAQGSTATATLNANPVPAQETVGGWTRFAEGTVGIAALNADPVPANGVLNQWVGGVSRTRGTATLDANPGPANGQVAGWKGRADGTTGTANLNANPGQANAATSGWKGAADRTTATATLSADPGPANAIAQGFYNSWAGRVIRFVLSAVTGAAAGGPVVNGRAGGGPIHGPGTGTSDTAGLYALSNGEHVLTAREVAAAGGHAAIFALRRSLTKGRVPRMTAMRGMAAAGGSVSSSGALSLPTPQVAVSVHIGDREITDIVRTEISTSNRQTRRTVGMGAGTTF